MMKSDGCAAKTDTWSDHCSVSAAHCALFVMELEARRISPISALARAGIGPADVRADVALRAQDFVAFLDEVHRLTNDDDVGLRAGQRLELAHLDLMGVLLRSCAHGLDVIGAIRAHGKLWGRARDADVQLSTRGVRVVHRSFGAQGTAQRLVADMVLSRTVRCAELITDAPPPSAVSFAYAAPRSSAQHARIFKTARLVFSAEASAVSYGVARIREPLRFSDSAVRSVVEPHVARLAHQAPEEASDVIGRVRSLITRELADGGANLRKLAGRLHVSERHLRRQLGELGTSYRSLLDEVRQDHVRAQIARSPEVTGPALSQQLGFADPATFYRAYLRWTGSRWSEREASARA